MTLPALFRPLLFLALLASASGAGDPIRIGHIGSITGKEAEFGTSTRKGIILAIEEINAAGGLLGRPLEYHGEDVQSKAGESATATKKLLSRDKVAVILGGNPSADSLEAAPLCQNAKIPQIAISSTNPKVTKAGDYIFRMCFIDPFQGAVLAKFARENLHAQKIALLTAVTPYSTGLSNVLRQRFTALGGEVVAEQKYAEGDRDFKAQLTSIRAQQPDVIAATGYYVEAALICKQARELGLDLPIIGGDGWEAPQLTELGGAAVNGTYYSSHYSASNSAPEVQAFVKKFRDRWDGETPEAVAALGYDAVKLYADAVRRAGTIDGPKVRDALATTKDFPGVTGQTTIDADRNSSKPAVMLMVRNGRVEFVAAVAP